MTVTPTAIPDVLVIEPKVFSDGRGWFFESFNERDFSDAVGRQITFVQDNHSFSKKDVLRGLHYQTRQTQGKLVSVYRGVVFDVAVDLRQSSKTYGQSVGIELTSDNKKKLWVPEGFAHGFLVLSDEAEFLYKTTDYWDPGSEQCIAWNDSALNIQWPKIDGVPIMNIKDLQGLSWSRAPKFD
ncbi:dTDP-4-dehydrorhamnose 3,5-epimerase [Polynucleobacter sp. AM-26B4]|uniref:dTDP-4-dehydrorhamnose 3,5-epimerase n=1 Tax=Polynucleobacter sp. AM-26B4 TaxID=2689103 RepID=UPI001C0B46B0|nr:dTDP-4-dehydrorhamnose 3,5-epimerase [Polynucleobacter sp. AM-26B4]MBU3585121.1 dTDP-4-dehydrorhamnose 3,5-epimerase [Polynucleobacter sp. AM-26B4]